MFSVSRHYASALASLKTIRSSGSAKQLIATRFASSEAKEVFTNLSEENDPKRDAIFKYSWGTWLKNDEAEKRKRYTKFSLGGLQQVLKELYEDSRANTDTKITKVPAPKQHRDDFVSLPHNVNVLNFGSKSANEDFRITQLSSLHEGKHNRIYKVETNSQKSFILRLPYPLDTEYAIQKRIQSEAATLDFVDLKLGLNVPRVFAYGATNSNKLNSPFLLQEFIEGETLMKRWAPMTPRSDEKHKQIIGQVIDPLSEFNKFGSLYFNIDAKNQLETLDEPYEGETNESLKNRWFIGPSTERVFWRNKPYLRKSQIEPFIGPWPADKPLQIIEDIANLELENAKSKIAILNSGLGAVGETKEQLEEQIETFTNLKKVAPILMDTKAEGVKNVDALFAPRLAHTDLDPLNVLIDKENEEFFLDFEGATIKPIIFQSTPRFVAYEDGPKIYEFEIDEEKYKEMSETDKYYYDFAAIRTRNEVLWDLGLGKTFTELGSEGAPVFKRLRGPYLAAIERRTANETPLIDRKIYELALQWPQFAEHKFVTTEQFPVRVDSELFDKHAIQLEKYYEELSSVPFAVTGGWVPQDLFESLTSQGVIKKLDNGDYEIVQEKS
jgi:thiamine kinase-like enzyme